MTTLLRTGCGLLLGAMLWSTIAPLAEAQQTRTLTIRDGTIYVDDQRLTSDQMPSDLDLDGVTAQYQFVGIQRPVIELKGRLFAINDGLTPVSEEEVNGQKSSVILQEISARPSEVRSQPEAAESPQRQYLSDMQKANRQLYERLVRERTMEQQAQNLARVIRMLPDDSAERRAKVDTLRTLLNEIFDLKQENRRREIERLQRQIQEVQRSLQERRQMRDRMIDRRLNQLLGVNEQ
jgi:chromosome segregation ATPase